MWNQLSANRITFEREKIKVRIIRQTSFVQDHMIHIDRLRQSKATIAISAPKKPLHMAHNMKKEL